MKTKTINGVNLDSLVKSIIAAIVTAQEVPVSAASNEPKAAKVAKGLFPVLAVTLSALVDTGNVTESGLAIYSAKAEILGGPKGMLVNPTTAKVKTSIGVAKVFTSSVYLPAGSKAPKSLSVEVKPELVLNKDKSAKHGAGGHSLKTKNTVKVPGGGKFYVNGYFPATA